MVGYANQRLDTSNMVDVYIASNIETEYPRKLQKPSTINQRVRDSSDTFIMDSGIGDEVSNQEVLDLALEYNADFVIAKDYLHDHEQTTESIYDFLTLYADHACESTPMIPLQPPFDEHYRSLDVEADHYVLGGMAFDDVGPVQQLTWIRDFNSVVGDEYVHALGVGGGIEFVTKVAGEGLVDSIDCSTPEQAAMFGSILDERLRQKQVRAFDSGEGAKKRNKALAEFNSWQLQDVWDREAKKQTGLAAYE